MNLAATVILYNPDQHVVSNILTYALFIEKLYILDNTESNNATIPIAEKIRSEIPNASYLAFNENMGTARRLNEAAKLARNDGYTHLLTMDQDSSFKDGVFKKYLDKITTHLISNNNIAVFAVNFQPAFTPIQSKPKEILSTITSGSIINLEIHEKIGGHDEKLFLDLVDADYCYRIAENGFKTVLFSDIILEHTIGYHVKGRSIKNFKVTERKIHPPIRIYYLVRNSLYLLNKKKLPLEARREIWKSLSLLKNNLLYNKTGKVIKYIFKAFKDYKKDRMGKISL